MQNDERRIAVFIDFENVAMGVRESNYGNFDIELVLKRLVEKGKIMVKRAYSDWHRYSEFKRAFHQAAIELIDVPQTRYSGKNSADIRIVVDALDLSHQKDHIDTFVLVSGDSDFSPLVSKLRENGRYVIGMGVKQSSSDLLVNNCDEFIYYEDLVRPTAPGPALDPKLRNLPHRKAEALRLVLETFEALQREGKESIYGSMIKQTLVRKLPSFNESYFGYPTFSRLLEDAAENKLLKLTKDQKSGGYIVTATTETSAQSAALTTALGEASRETATAEETVPADTASAAALGSSEARDYYRRSRWGRGRWSHGPQRIGNVQAPRQFPVQQDSTLPQVTPPATATSEPQEPAVSATPPEEVVSPITKEEVSTNQPVAQATVEVGSTPLAQAVPGPAESREPERRSHRRGRRGRASQRPAQPAKQVQESSTTPGLSVANPETSIVAEDREPNLNTLVRSEREAQVTSLPPAEKEGREEAVLATQALATKRPGSRRASKRKGRGGRTAANKPRKKQ